MERHLARRPVLVAGGTGALGAAVIERLVADGARPVVLDQRLPPDGRAQPAATYRARSTCSMPGRWTTC